MIDLEIVFVWVILTSFKMVVYFLNECYRKNSVNDANCHVDLASLNCKILITTMTDYKYEMLTWLDSVGSKKTLARLDGGHGGERYSRW